MQKLNYYQNFQPAFSKLMEIETKLHSSVLDKRLIHLVKMRVSQINGCAFCIDMHAKQAKIDGEKELRLYHLSAWNESPLFNAKERAALLWTEAVTNLNVRPVSDDTFSLVKEHFSDKELTELNMAIGLINLWNRFGAPFSATPGSMDKAMGLEKAGL